MHFEFLIEDLSGKKLLDILVPKIIRATDSFLCKEYKGIGHIPKKMTVAQDPAKRHLLTQLPRLLAGYGKNPYYKESATIVVVCDLDNRCFKTFREELLEVLSKVQQSPNTKFCFAIEEGEAWLLGDVSAIKAAYPRAKDSVLNSYSNDSICGTWEFLADVLLPKGHKALKAKGFQEIGRHKSLWAETIGPHMNVDINTSPSFCYFRDTIRTLSSTP